MIRGVNPIQGVVARRGGVRFRDFMEMALYDGDHGYYGAGRAALGRGGDFFTNVTVGGVYGRLLAGQFVEMWEVLGRPGIFSIVEQGANDGTLAGDVMGWCAREAREFYEALRYEIVEGNAGLRERQGERLGEFGGKVVWHDGLGGLGAFTGVHFSNELVDALPAHRVRYREGEWRELWVTGELEWAERPVEDAELAGRVAGLPRLEGYTTEVNLDAVRWAEAVAGKVERGWVLTVDYGYPWAQYYAPGRVTGTLECYAGHARGLDPLANPGFCDLTAHVDFTSLARAFMKGGMEVAGYADQHHFLTGLVARAFADGAPSAKEARELKTLLHPEMLGTAFKALAVGRGVGGARLSGFRFAREAGGELGI